MLNFVYGGEFPASNMGCTAIQAYDSMGLEIYGAKLLFCMLVDQVETAIKLRTNTQESKILGNKVFVDDYARRLYGRFYITLIIMLTVWSCGIGVGITVF